MRKEVINQLETVKEITVVEARVLARGRTAELCRKTHTNPSQPVSPESVNSLQDRTVKGQQDPRYSVGVVEGFTMSKIVHNVRELNGYPKSMKHRQSAM